LNGEALEQFDETNDFEDIWLCISQMQLGLFPRRHLGNSECDSFSP
jgi:hypothetical protein